VEHDAPLGRKIPPDVGGKGVVKGRKASVRLGVPTLPISGFNPIKAAPKIGQQFAVPEPQVGVHKGGHEMLPAPGAGITDLSEV